MVKLEQPALDAYTSKKLPPAPYGGGQLVMKTRSMLNRVDVDVSGVDLPSVPYNVTDPEEGRRYFMTALIRILAAQPELRASTSDLGQCSAVQSIWRQTGLNNTYKMVEIVKERPDLVMIKKDSDGANAQFHLTNLGMAYAPGYAIPEPDSSCPPRQTPKKIKHAAGNRGYHPY
eukprot:gnl/MRDRNA2_/MRDRNA2_17121_c0_seq1.p1 gnl/MRDRNA2_/MRDRNA2_17121_c0~~gnl/MRDRNA2_/MRDRNA2_17121_c0_seq1.p1  ORF type:complete len:174 (+),score=25.99 gnl/MRDRNA2_/MRDRNA2_17121_c0_seq1:70-591(+)